MKSMDPALEESARVLGAGKRLFDHLGTQTIELERTQVVESPFATHLYFTVRR